MRSRTPILFVLLIASSFVAAAQQNGDIPRTSSGRPDLSGFYDVSTLTPLQRPNSRGDQLTLTEEEAATSAERERARQAGRQEASDPNREAPPEGGDGSPGAAGNVGGYNSFWIDRGTAAFQIDGEWRTSIIYEPENGRRPSLTPAGQQGIAAFASFWRPNTGKAWWLDVGDGSGPYDDMELRPLAERCLLGFSSTSGPPMLPALYNNLKRIVQTEETVVILVEMVHDARIIRMNGEHDPPEIRKWLGDSVGHWEGDTLVVDTINFTDRPGLSQASSNLHVVERFSKNPDGTLHYQFTVDDPTIWTAPWSGEYPWRPSEERVFEYACHEANYSFFGIMGGARMLEAEARGEKIEGIVAPPE